MTAHLPLRCESRSTFAPSSSAWSCGSTSSNWTYNTQPELQLPLKLESTIMQYIRRNMNSLWCAECIMCWNKNFSRERSSVPSLPCLLDLSKWPLTVVMSTWLHIWKLGTCQRMAQFLVDKQVILHCLWWVNLIGYSSDMLHTAGFSSGPAAVYPAHSGPSLPCAKVRYHAACIRWRQPATHALRSRQHVVISKCAGRVHHYNRPLDVSQPAEA